MCSPSYFELFVQRNHKSFSCFLWNYRFCADLLSHSLVRLNPNLLYMSNFCITGVEFFESLICCDMKIICYIGLLRIQEIHIKDTGTLTHEQIFFFVWSLLSTDRQQTNTQTNWLKANKSSDHCEVIWTSCTMYLVCFGIAYLFCILLFVMLLFSFSTKLN